jgi:hypothetical protein
MMQILIGFAGGNYPDRRQTSLVAVLPPWLPFYNSADSICYFFEPVPSDIRGPFADFWVGADHGHDVRSTTTVYLIIFYVLFILFRNIRTYFQLVDSVSFCHFDRCGSRHRTSGVRHGLPDASLPVKSHPYLPLTWF